MGAPLPIEPAAEPDLPAIRALLAAVGLPAGDVGAPGQHYLVARGAGGLQGCVGYELHGADALLRSLAVAPAAQGTGLGRALAARAQAQARAGGARAMWILTTTAQAFAARDGFAPVPRREAPQAIREHPQFRTLCPATAVLMVKRVAQRSGDE